jgi:uncharacterized coiled-coil protein SlyX
MVYLFLFNFEIFVEVLSYTVFMGKNDVLTEDRFYYLMTKFYQDFLSIKFDELEERLGERIDGAEGKLGERMDEIEERMSVVEKKLDRVAEIVTDTRTNHERRIRRIEKKMGLSASVLVN